MKHLLSTGLDALNTMCGDKHADAEQCICLPNSLLSMGLTAQTSDFSTFCCLCGCFEQKQMQDYMKGKPINVRL